MKLSQEDFLTTKKIHTLLSDLQSGLPLILRNHLVFSAEFFDYKILDLFDLKYSTNFGIIITDKRAISLGIEVENNKYLKLSCTSEKISNLIKNQVTHGSVNFEKLNEEESNCAEIGIALTKLAKILPMLVIHPIDENNQIRISNNYQITYCSEELLRAYSKIKNEYVEEICRSKITLKDAKNSEIVVFRDFPFFGKTHLAIIIGELNNTKSPLIRIHSGCYTGDLLQSLQCDCHEQLHNTIKYMNDYWLKKECYGVIVYQAEDEGRAIGLSNKIRTYHLQKMNYDTVDANHAIGYEDDERDFTTAMKILNELKIDKCKLITNNPNKISCFLKHNIHVENRVSIESKYSDHSKDYLNVKKEKMGHLSP